MPRTCWTGIVACLFLPCAGLHAEDIDEPLFASHDLLDVSIAAPLTSLMRERSKEDEIEARLSYTDPAGEPVETTVRLRTRGNYRHRTDVCPFAPLRLNFRRSQMDGTVFAGQDKLKLVTHCRNSTRHEQIALKEYLTYRMFNRLTDLSFRVRLMRITWIDTDKNNRQNQRYGFVIEHKDRFAERTGLPVFETERTSVSALAPEHTNLISVFQFFAGNTDFSPIAGARGENCCHNVTLFGGADSAVVPVPYDFDMSGLVDAPYATPNPRFGIRNVRQRLYRGRCVNNEHLATSLAAFQAQKEGFYELVNNGRGLTGSARRSMIGFLNSFYKVIDNPKAVESKLVKMCIQAR